MVRKKQKRPAKKCTCPKPILTVIPKQRQAAHRKRSQNLFGGFHRPRPFYVGNFANNSSKFRSGLWIANWTTPSAQGIHPSNTTMQPLFAD